MQDKATHYEVLGVENYASREDIRKAYREFCLSSHPDKVKYKDPRDAKRAMKEFLTRTESYKYLMANKDLYDNLTKQSDFSNYRERVAELNDQEDELISVGKEAWVFPCR